MRHGLKWLLKRIWSDPVWSKVIGGLITAFVVMIFAHFASKTPGEMRPKISTYGDQSPVYAPERDFIQYYHSVDPVLLKQLVDALNNNTEEIMNVRREQRLTAATIEKLRSPQRADETATERRLREQKVKELQEKYAKLNKTLKLLLVQGDELKRQIRELAKGHWSSRHVKPNTAPKGVDKSLPINGAEHNTDQGPRIEMQSPPIGQLSDTNINTPLNTLPSSNSRKVKINIRSGPDRSFSADDIRGSSDLPSRPRLDNVVEGIDESRDRLSSGKIQSRIKSTKRDTMFSRELAQRKLALQKRARETQEKIIQQKKKVESLRHLYNRLSTTPTQGDKSHLDAPQTYVSAPLGRKHSIVPPELVEQTDIDALGVKTARLGGEKIRFRTKRESHADVNSNDIQFVQNYLNRNGFNAGPVDGIPGPQTQSALADLQRSKQLDPTGILTNALVQRIRGWDANDGGTTADRSEARAPAVAESERRLVQPSWHLTEQLRESDAGRQSSTMVVHEWQPAPYSDKSSESTPNGLGSGMTIEPIKTIVPNSQPDGVYSGHQAHIILDWEDNDLGTTGEGTSLADDFRSRNILQESSSGVIDLDRSNFDTYELIPDPSWSTSNGIQSSFPSGDGVGLDAPMPSIPNNPWK